jgi:hypothetical protein
MKASSAVRFSELQLVLEPERSELVRAFVREASLADGVSLATASLIADDTAHAWLALCAPGSDRERARIVMLCRTRTPGSASCCTAILDFRKSQHRLPPNPARRRHLLP